MSMSRWLVCTACADALRLHQEDKENGFKERRVPITKARRPAGLARTWHTISAEGERTKDTELVRTLQCDACSAEIEDGQPCTAVTHWRGVEPDKWEKEYEQNG